MADKNTSTPFFRYHPSPIESVAFGQGTTVCDCCHKPSELFYAGPFYSSHIFIDLCPECIASGRAARELKGCFTPPDCMDDIHDDEKRAEIAYRTPSYFCLQQPYWIAHCGDYCAYLGAVDEMVDENWKSVYVADALSDEIWAEIEETWNDRPQYYEFEWVKRNLGAEIDGYLFQCLHCGKHLLYIQRD